MFEVARGVRVGRGAVEECEREAVDNWEEPSGGEVGEKGPACYAQERI